MAGQAFGIIGLEVMGRNLALNIERNGFPIAVYNRTYAKTEDFLNRLAKGKKAKGAKTIQERRVNELTGTGIKFFGMGVSGGEEGALWGPSLMPGGDQDAYRHLEPILK